jgi:hypothetical protein
MFPAPFEFARGFAEVNNVLVEFSLGQPKARARFSGSFLFVVAKSKHGGIRVLDSVDGAVQKHSRRGLNVLLGAIVLDRLVVIRSCRFNLNQCTRCVTIRRRRFYLDRELQALVQKRFPQ